MSQVSHDGLDSEEHSAQRAAAPPLEEPSVKLPRITPVGSSAALQSGRRRSSCTSCAAYDLIGRAPSSPELEKYSIYGGKLLSVRPGLSGMWQVCGRSDTTYPQRVMMDMHYIDHRSLSLDLWLMLFTIAAVVRKSGAC